MIWISFDIHSQLLLTHSVWRTHTHSTAHLIVHLSLIPIFTICSVLMHLIIIFSPMFLSASMTRALHFNICFFDQCAVNRLDVHFLFNELNSSCYCIVSVILWVFFFKYMHVYHFEMSVQSPHGFLPEASTVLWLIQAIKHFDLTWRWTSLIHGLALPFVHHRNTFNAKGQ